MDQLGNFCINARTYLHAAGEMCISPAAAYLSKLLHSLGVTTLYLNL